MFPWILNGQINSHGKGKERTGKITEKANNGRRDVFLLTGFTETLSNNCLWIKKNS